VGRRPRCLAPTPPGAMRRLAPAVLVAVWGAAGAEEGSCPAGGCEAKGGYHWPNVRGLAGQYGVSNLTVPKDLSKPSWRWHHESGQYGTVVVGGPVIDDESNLYFTEMTKLLKMSRDGQVIWTASPPPGTLFPDGPSIHNGGVFQSTMAGELCKFRMDSGERVWCKKYYAHTGADSKYVTSHDGVVVIGTDNAQQQGGGSKHVLGISTETGEKLWDFAPDLPTWNNMGMFTHEDTVVLQDWDAKVYCLGLHNGSLLWKNGGNDGRTWTDGGTIIGANGVVYSHWARRHQAGASTPFLGGGISAYRLSDGKFLWTREMRHGVYTWPVAGRLHDGDDRWSVVTAAGAIPPCAPWKAILGYTAQQTAPRAFWGLLVLEAAVFLLSWCKLPCRKWRAMLLRLLAVFVVAVAVSVYGCYSFVSANSNFPGEITAFDAETGDVRWHYDLPPWMRVAARGDEEGWIPRWKTPWRGTCCPASFGSPSVDGDGTVYVGFVSGVFYGIKDRNADGRIDESEVRTFDAEAAFLHSGPAFAPGIFAFSTCDSVWAWRT